MFTEIRLLLCILILLIGYGQTETYKRVCYFINWGQYREGDRKFTTAQLYEPNLCTHYIFAFAKVRPELDSIGPIEHNDEGTYGNFAQLVDLKKWHPGLKILLAIGGWNHGTEPFTAVVSSDTRVLRFCTNVIIFLRSRGFDGLDLDWEYPAHRGSEDEDRERFTFLVQTLRSKFDDEAFTTGKPRLILAAAVPALKSMVTKGYEVEKIAKSLDFVNLMAYDYDVARDNLVYLAPLYPRQEDEALDESLNVDASVDLWLTQGMPGEKIILGIPLYGRLTPTLNSTNYTYGEEVEFNTTKVAVGQDTICQNLRDGWPYKYDDVAKTAVMYKDEEWINYENVDSVAAKGNYIKEKKLGGAMVWELSVSDFHGTECGIGRYPLLSKLRDLLPSPPPPPPPPTQSTPKSATPPSTECQPGTFANDVTGACSPCQVGTYQNEVGQAKCKECQGEMTTEQKGATSMGQCVSPCKTDEDRCGVNGVCRWDEESLTATCRCLINYGGDKCETYTEPKGEETDLPLIVGASVGGVLGLAALILLICGCVICYRIRLQEKRRPVQHPEQTIPGTIPVDFQDYIDFRLWKHNVGSDSVFGTRIPPPKRQTSRLNFSVS